MIRTIQVFEFEKLTLHKDQYNRFLKKEELTRLYEFNDRNNNVYFTGIRDGIKFNNYVGVIQIGGLTIEILPKTDKKANVEEDFTTWQRVLLDMLRACKLINSTSVSETNLKRKHNSLLELYYEMYLDEVQNLIHNGLVKQYRRNSGNVLALKGQLKFTQHIQQNLIHKERFYTNHQVYDYENIANQILLKALMILNQLSRTPQLKDKIQRLLMSFPEIKEINIAKEHFNRIPHNRKLKAYDKALNIAQMIILNYSPDIRTGQENMLALLFDMNKLWEEYIYRMLTKTKRDDIAVSFQNKQKFWESRTVRPDLVITHTTGELKQTYIIDTKWKILDAANPKPSDDDLKQMYAYNLYWKPTEACCFTRESDQDITKRLAHSGKAAHQNKLTNVKSDLSTF